MVIGMRGSVEVAFRCPLLLWLLFPFMGSFVVLTLWPLSLCATHQECI
jgi:hypothetical protein